jgi:hypothetical protein
MACLIATRGLHHGMLEREEAPYAETGRFLAKDDLHAAFKGRGGQASPAPARPTRRPDPRRVARSLLGTGPPAAYLFGRAAARELLTPWVWARVAAAGPSYSISEVVVQSGGVREGIVGVRWGREVA